jgi:hypothetical protein
MSLSTGGINGKNGMTVPDESAQKLRFLLVFVVICAKMNKIEQIHPAHLK